MNQENEKKMTKSEEFVKIFLQQAMGEILDMLRVSPVNDRQLNQFERTIRNKFNNTIVLFQEKLKLKDDEVKN